jgi:putative hemolysin
MDITRLSEFLSIDFEAKDYTTLGGFMMERLGKIPEEGDIVDYLTYKFEVIDMDGKRVDKVLIEKLNNLDTA